MQIDIVDQQAESRSEIVGNIPVNRMVIKDEIDRLQNLFVFTVTTHDE